ncbi:hypothetical protein M9H77_36471 [Catharanthus roseus]|uniref:Uncharacterized protein n=1 Tax=Catharanthus roseus TaxID=4058 RepID=A0ACB9ZRV3_CATRO|nr:hypothetical protein M9H77_36471 [Catharanthus roseus]
MGDKTGNFRPSWQNFSYIFPQTGEAVDNQGHAQAARLTKEQLQQIKQFRKKRDVGCAVNAQKIYTVVAKIKKNRMYGRNTVDEVLCLSEQRGYTVFCRNGEESNVLSDIIIAYLTSIAIIRTWPYVLIIDTTYKMNKVWTSEVLHFGVETMNRAESKHSALKLWLSTCHGDFDTVFLNMDSLIEGQIAEIKTSLEISKLKEKYDAKSNPILKNISNNISHLALKKIWLEIKREREIFDDPQNKCRHYLRNLRGLPCACELVGRNVYALPLQMEDIYIFWRKLEIGVDIPNVHERDMDFEMRDLSSMLEEIIMKGQKKMNSTKKDKFYWEHMTIAHRKIEKSSESGSGSRSCSGSGFGSSPCGRGRPSHSSKGRGRGRISGRSSLSSIINPNATLTRFPFRSIAVLPLYCNMDCTIGTLCIGFISDQQHFIQVTWRTKPYNERIAEWVRRSRAMYPTQGLTHVVIP